MISIFMIAKRIFWRTKYICKNEITIFIRKHFISNEIIFHFHQYIFNWYFWVIASRNNAKNRDQRKTLHGKIKRLIGLVNGNLLAVFIISGSWCCDHIIQIGKLRQYIVSVNICFNNCRGSFNSNAYPVYRNTVLIGNHAWNHALIQNWIYSKLAICKIVLGRVYIRGIFRVEVRGITQCKSSCISGTFINHKCGAGKWPFRIISKTLNCYIFCSGIEKWLIKRNINVIFSGFHINWIIKHRIKRFIWDPSIFKTWKVCFTNPYFQGNILSCRILITVKIVYAIDLTCKIQFFL